VVGRQNADIADTLYLRDVAMATTFCIPMGYNFSGMIVSHTMFNFIFGVKLSEEDIVDFEHLRGVAMGTIFWLFIYGAHIGATWRIRLNLNVLQRCGLMSNYFDHLLFFITPHKGRTHADTIYKSKI